MVISARALRLEQSLVPNGDDLGVRLKPNGGITSDADGLFLEYPNPTDIRGTLDPAGGGGTIALPTIAAATVSPGVAFSLGDFYLVLSTGTVGGLAVQTAPAQLSYTGNGAGDGSTDADWAVIDGPDITNLVAKSLTLTAGNGLTGGGDLTANRSFAVDPAQLKEGGNAAIDADQLRIDITLPSITPDTTDAEVTTATQLGAILKGINNALAAPVLRQEVFTLAAADIAAKQITVSVAPTQPANATLDWTEGGTATQGDGLTITGAIFSWNGGAFDGALQVGDVLVAQYL